MSRHWTYGQKVSAGFAAIVILTVAMAALAIFALRGVVTSKDRVISQDAQMLVEAQKLYAAAEHKGGAARGFLLTGEERYLQEVRESRRQVTDTVERLKRGADTDEERRLLDAIEQAETEHHQAVENVLALRRTGAAPAPVARAFDEQVVPRREELDAHIRSFVTHQEHRLEEAKQAATKEAGSAITLVVAIAVAVVLLASLVAFILTRTLGRQIGSAVGQVQSSSAELQAAANQQATGAREQATAMSEITTTISELLATSRQIADSAQRVAHIAEQTAAAAHSGEKTVGRAHESITAIRRQVDLVVTHMLDLGKKSQQIGSVLDIVSELAEQTNILAINATIEAAGAGEAGKRFAMVADEIRKLADRVAASTKEIRGLIEDVRSAVNTTVMATESGSKAVDAGSRQFAEVASALQQIAALVATTTEAAREIQLSTKQQTTAFEQANLAVTNVAQATKETEASSSQTLQTASQLAEMSRGLLRLIRPPVTA